MEQIENILLHNQVMYLSELKYLLMANKPAGVTDSAIYELLSFYGSL